MKPRYRHDCQFCVFLGRLREFDFYYHERGSDTEYVVRASADDDDFIKSVDLDNEVYKDLLEKYWSKKSARKATALHMTGFSILEAIR